MKMTYEQKVAEWDRLNRLGYSGCKGAVALRLRHMDKIAKEIGYPLSMPIYKEERDTQRNG